MAESQNPGSAGARRLAGARRGGGGAADRGRGGGGARRRRPGWARTWRSGRRRRRRGGRGGRAAAAAARAAVAPAAAAAARAADGRGGRGGDSRGGGEREGSDLIENVIAINRVAKVVKGGRRFCFNALVAVGDGQGKRGLRHRQGERSVGGGAQGGGGARAGTWSQHAAHGERRSRTRSSASTAPGRVLMKPAAPGAGVIAGGAVRAVLECAGMTDILTKSLGSTNPHNMVRAAMDGLHHLTTVEQIARERGVEPSAACSTGRARSRRRRCTCHGHSSGIPARGPSQDASRTRSPKGKVRIEQVRSGIGHSRRDARGRSRRSACGITRTSS